MQKRLTEASVEKLKPDPNKRIEIHDLAVSNLRLRISPTGKKSWSLMYKIAGEAPDGGRGKNRRLSLGQYPLIGLADARQRAMDALNLADKGQDPAAEKKAVIQERASKRIESLVPRYIELHAKPNTKNWKDTDTLLKKTVKIKWQGREVDTITRGEIHTYLDELLQKEGVSKAREVRKHFSIFYNWCVDRGYSDFNPMAGMKRNDLSYVPRERVLSLDELKAIWNACDQIAYPFGPIVRLLILTGQRRSEIGGLKRSWVSEDRIEVPAENYKTGVAHIVPLTKQAKAILDQQPLWNHGEFVFSTTNGKTASSGFSKAKLRFDKLLDLEPWTFHDIRRSVATHMAQQGVIQEHIERVLGHVIPSVAGTYNRYSYFVEKKNSLKTWETKCFS